MTMRNEWTMDRPRIALLSGYTIALPIMGAKVNSNAKLLMALAHQFKVYGCNLYKFCDNRALARMLDLSDGQLFRAKQQLRNKGYVNYRCEFNPVKMQELKDSYRNAFDEEYGGELWV